MKIKKIYISSFGKLKDFSLDFNQGITQINQPNGWGKSTLAMFIKSIFYGLSDKKKGVLDNERKKYKPWNSAERFGGYAIIERAGRDYKVERFFGNKASEDTVSVIDVKTGKSFSTLDLGKKFFQIDEEGFLSTTFLSQKDFEIKSNASLTAKFNEGHDGLDTLLFDKALKKLEERQKIYKVRGDKGLVSETKSEIRRVQEQIERATLCEEMVKTLYSTADQLVLEINQLSDKIKKITGEVALAGKTEVIKIKRENLEKLNLERKTIAGRITEIERKLNNNIDGAKRVKDFSECLSQMKTLSDTERLLREELSSLGNQKPSHKSSKSILKLGLSGVLLASGVGLCFVNWIIGAPLILASLLLGCFSLLKSKGDNSVNLNAEKKRQEVVQCNELFNKTRTVLENYLDGFNIDYVDYGYALKEIEESVFAYENFNREIVNKEKQIQSLISDDDLNLQIQQTYDLKELNFTLEQLNVSYSEKVKRLAEINARIKEIENQASKVVEYEEELTDLKEKLEKEQKEYEIINLTLEYLNKADENLKIKYRAPLQNNLDKYTALLSDDKIKANIDIDLKVTALENGISRDIDYYSEGTKNLIEICVRFALVEALFTEDKPPIILDDPFVNLDGEKLSNALKFLEKISKEYQIIYLICHESRGRNV